MPGVRGAAPAVRPIAAGVAWISAESGQ